MAKRSDFIRTARTLRALDDLALNFAVNSPIQRAVTLIVGAGLDVALAALPNWADLMGNLLKKLAPGDFSADRIKVFEQVMNSHPAEGDEVLNILFGQEQHQSALRNEFAGKPPNQNDRLADALVELLTASSPVSLIINLNFSNVLRKALEARREAGKLERPIVSIEREQLSAFNPRMLLGRPIRENAPLYILHLHGRIDGDGSSLVFSQSSYEEAMFRDEHYAKFLDRVFTETTALSFGVSWVDIPLRMHATQGRYSFPIAGPIHLAIFGGKADKRKTYARLADEDLWRERAFVAAYSIRRVCYDGGAGKDHGGAIAVLEHLRERALAKANRPDLYGSKPWDEQRTTLSDLANWLDAAGDYESLEQTAHFGGNRAFNKTLQVLRSIDNNKPTSWEDFVLLARIERHFRHFVWIYETPTRRPKTRREIWMGIASALKNKSFMNRFSRALNNGSRYQRALFEFALGAYECAGRPGDGKEVIEACKKIDDKLLKNRFEMATVLWKRTDNAEALGKLKTVAIACGWESIHAKIALDLCQNAAKRWKNNPHKTNARRDVRMLARDAREAARLAGTRRRLVGAVVHGAVVHADPAEAREELLACYHGVLGALGQESEPFMAWNVILGLVSVWLTSRQGYKLEERFLRKTASAVDKGTMKYAGMHINMLRERVQEELYVCLGPRPSVGNRKDLIKSLIQGHWKKYDPLAASLTTKLIE